MRDRSTRSMHHTEAAIFDVSCWHVPNERERERENVSTACWRVYVRTRLRKNATDARRGREDTQASEYVTGEGGREAGRERERGVADGVSREDVTRYA